MYAVIQSGGKQYRVQPGDTLEVELVEGDQGATIDLSDVLLVADGEKIQIGKPHVAGAKVTAEVVDPDKKGKKVIAFKFGKRKRYHRKIGVRPHHTILKIKEIQA